MMCLDGAPCASVASATRAGLLMHAAAPGCEVDGRRSLIVIYSFEILASYSLLAHMTARIRVCSILSLNTTDLSREMAKGT